MSNEDNLTHKQGSFATEQVNPFLIPDVCCQKKQLNKCNLLSPWHLYFIQWEYEIGIQKCYSNLVQTYKHQCDFQNYF